MHPLSFDALIVFCFLLSLHPSSSISSPKRSFSSLQFSLSSSRDMLTTGWFQLGCPFNKETSSLDSINSKREVGFIHLVARNHVPNLPIHDQVLILPTIDSLMLMPKSTSQVHAPQASQRSLSAESHLELAG